MHGYIRNHATRIAYIPPDDIERQKQSIVNQVNAANGTAGAVNDADSDDRLSKTIQETSTDGRGGSANYIQEKETQYFRLDTGEQFENLQQLIDQSGGPNTASIHHVLYTQERSDLLLEQ